jgi:hypothetical protein
MRGEVNGLTLEIIFKVCKMNLERLIYGNFEKPLSIGQGLLD